jgi:hypothetical protein
MKTANRLWIKLQFSEIYITLVLRTLWTRFIADLLVKGMMIVLDVALCANVAILVSVLAALSINPIPMTLQRLLIRLLATVEGLEIQPPSLTPSSMKMVSSFVDVDV